MSIIYRSKFIVSVPRLSWHNVLNKKIPSFLKILKKEKTLQQNAKGLEISWLPEQDVFRNYCMRDEIEKVYYTKIDARRFGRLHFFVRQIY